MTWRNPITGRREHKSFATRDDALRHDSEIKHRIKFDPQSFAPADALPRGALTISSLLGLYLDDRKFSPKNLRETLYHVKPVTAAVGRTPVADLTLNDLRSMVAGFRAHGTRQITINRRVSILKAALRWAEYVGIIERNPVPRFDCPRGHETRIAPPTPAEITRIMEAAPPHVRRVVVAGLALGIRIGQSELFRIRWADIDTQRGIVRVWAAQKNEKRPWRDLHIRDDLRPVFVAWMQQDAEEKAKLADGDGFFETLIHWKGKPVTHIKTAWKKTLLHAGITRRLRPYDLRHAFATYSIDAGADPRAVAEVMGHSDMSMVHRHYQHVLDRQRRAVMDKSPAPHGEHFGELSEGYSVDFTSPASKNIQ